MLKLNIYSIGKIKEDYFKNAINEYTKMLGSYANINMYEFQDEKIKDNLSLLEIENIKHLEARKILDKISDKEYLIALDIKGKELSSIDFSKTLSSLMTGGNSEISFVIGASLGLSNKILNRADLKLSFGKMTYPHKLMRVILMEQIYRAFRIMNNHPYHK